MRLPSFVHVAHIALRYGVVGVLGAGFAVAADGPRFNDDVRPILVEHCFSCHGADSASRQADLRLDLRDEAVESGAIVPGDPDSSVLLDRIFSDDPDEVMPPPATKKPLTAEHKEILKRWIAAGAEYQPHWSFIPPKRPYPPAVQNEAWVRNPIDRFILARLEAEGLEPAPTADRRTLARRLALDLTGLPPDPVLVEAFAADPHPDAYERLVDTLLTTLDWGEHRARHWLDYARYGDTNGIHIDNRREMWSYRQWVINAFNRNVPFDRFTILQLAGDLVGDHGTETTPAEILDDRIASGFNRCNITTSEGGAIDEEYLVLYNRDRTETTAAVWMGLTAGCAVCHDHKFDPLSQREFYELAAFFNNTTQPAMDGNRHDTPPILAVPRPEELPRFAALEREIPGARDAVAARREAAKPEFEGWVRQADAATVARVLPQDTPLIDLPLTEGQGAATRVGLFGKQTDLPLAEKATWQAGPSGKPALVLDGRAAELPTAGDLEHDQPFTVSMWVRLPANDSSYALIARMDEEQGHRGWDVWVQGRTIALHLIHAWPDDAIKVESTKKLPADTWTLVTISYDGSGKAAGVAIAFDGKPAKTKSEKDSFQKHSIRTQVPLTIGSRSKGATAHGVGLAGVSIWGRAFTAAEVESLAKGERLARLVTLPVEERSNAAAPLYDWWLTAIDAPYRESVARVAALESEMDEIKKRGTIAHVMNEKPDMPKAYVLDRGEYDKRKDEVSPDTPGVLPPFPESLPKNRLGLAKWLLLQEHPLTARVTVNRFWQEVFGTGLVRTSGDFGVTGELPSHPALLDWLAIEFRETGWDVKRLFRLMVTSAAYRQAATVTPDKLAKDGANRLLSRGPRFRMDAEMVRDYALAASGLLVRQIGGPSVKPYQPDGVWEAVSMGGDTNTYKRDSGENLYRKSMYWFWKRTAPPASMDIFNAPSRETCVIRRERTNTPLQALVTLNDPQFVEAARVLADRAWEVGGSDDSARLDFIAKRILSRPLDAAEKPIVQRSLNDLVAWYAAHPDEARQVVAVGDSRPRHADPAVLAAWTMVTNEFFNLDETLCK